MSVRVKNAIYTLILLGLIFIVWNYRDQSAADVQKQEISGQTMGTTYTIIYFGKEDPVLKDQIDSLLNIFNQSLNTWLEDSEISIFNKGTSFEFSLPYFRPVLKASDEIHAMTSGAFDPTVMALVNVWGFGPGKEMEPDSSTVDSILSITGFDKISYSEEFVNKEDKRVQLDFSAIAKGYGVDVVSDFLLEKDYSNHFVEIGGEVRCQGENIKTNKSWIIGITDPRSTIGNPQLIATVNVKDKSVATSGNYYNYRTRDGKRYSHTISPFTGYPIEQEILSATVITDECMNADAIATSFMVLGHERAIEITEENSSIESIIIYTGKNGVLERYVSSALLENVKFVDGQ